MLVEQSTGLASFLPASFLKRLFIQSEADLRNFVQVSRVLHLAGTLRFFLPKMWCDVPAIISIAHGGIFWPFFQPFFVPFFRKKWDQKWEQNWLFQEKQPLWLFLGDNLFFSSFLIIIFLVHLNSNWVNMCEVTNAMSHITTILSSQPPPSMIGHKTQDQQTMTSAH